MSEDSQTTTQTVIYVADAALLEASAPLIFSSLANNTGTTVTQFMTNRYTVEIARGQLIASLPTDALGLLQLDAAKLTSAGALFDVSGDGFLALNWNLDSPINGNQLNVGNLVALSV